MPNSPRAGVRQGFEEQALPGSCCPRLGLGAHADAPQVVADHEFRQDHREGDIAGVLTCPPHLRRLGDLLLGHSAALRDVRSWSRCS